VAADTSNFIPFGIITVQIEDYLYDYIPLSDIVTYLLSRILAFIPYGFYITLLLRRQSRLPRFFALLLLPFLIEVLQYIFIPARCDIGDLIYALIGGLLGTLLFYLMNVIFRAFSGKDFLAKENDYRFANSPLHF
jgi:glycopeptide antibiotics resistance protein